MTRDVKYVLTPEREALMYTYYNGTSSAIDDLVERTGVPRRILSYWAVKLQLSRRIWSDDDICYLEKHISHDRLEDIAFHLKRSVQSVEAMSERLGITKRSSDGFNRDTLAQGFGVSHHVIQKWMDAGYLHPTRRQTAHPRDTWYFSERDVRRFIFSHPLELNRFREKLDIVWLITMLKRTRP
jgi:hypothetical protein